MKQTGIVASRKPSYYAIRFVIFAILLILAIRFPLSGSGRSPHPEPMNGSDLVAGSPEKFALLSGRGGERSIGST